MKKRFLSLLALPAFCASCAKSYTYYGKTLFDVFDSFFSFTFNSDEGDYSSDIETFVLSLTELADPYQNYEGVNNLYTLNQSNEEIAIDDTLLDLLEVALDAKSKTEGLFNPLIGTISKLWKDTLFAKEEVNQEEVDAAKAQLPGLLEEMNASSIVLNKEKKTAKRLGKAKIDLGGLVKGYCIDKVQAMVSSHKAERYLLNAGSSSLGLGKSGEGKDFTVTLDYQDEEKEEIAYSLSNIETSVSAIYEQTKTVGGITYSHLIDPRSGLPLTQYSMAFLSGSDSALLDAFSTACLLVSPKKSAEWASTYRFERALFEDQNGYASLVAETPNLTKTRAR